MNKEFKKIISIYAVFVIFAPIVLHYSIMLINFIPSLGNNGFMFQSYLSYFGGAISGLATIIVIYFTIIQTKENHRPMIYFRNSRFCYYKNLNGVFSKYSKKEELNLDDAVDELDNNIYFELLNLGTFPALDLKLTITNKNKLLDAVKLLKISDDELTKVEKSFSKDDQSYLVNNVFMQSSDTKIEYSSFIDHSVKRLIYDIGENEKKNLHVNNNHVVNGKFDVVDFKVEYKDIDGKSHEEIHTLGIRIDNTLGIISKLKRFEAYSLVFEFEKNMKY